MALIRAIFREAQREGERLEHIPAFRTCTRGSKVRVRFLTQDQTKALLAELPAHQAAVVLFALATGLRQGNILALTWDRVDMTRRIATIEHRDTKNGDALGVPLNDVAIGVLAKERGKHDSHVFTFWGAPLRNANNRAWRATLKACRIENFRWHDLRHTWATWLRQNDVPTWVLQELGGWKSATMVRRYAHMSVKHLQPYADQLIFEGQTGHSRRREEMPRQGHKSGHSDSPVRLKLVAGTDLSR
ncbi:tyrosine-type recombinase/integrase [Sphingomonas vulcanisoli]|uniref:tyrosine-type recombinase/integrase n=1 Tax=Sphingomonas vulcanisoli TaxID=1658060 RepID=UPI00141F218F